MAPLAKFLAALAALTLLAVPTASAQVPEPIARDLAAKLSRVEAPLAEQGYALAAGPLPGGIQQLHARQIPVTLRAGQDYQIVGVCDRNCGDLDVRLIDPRQALIAGDVRGNNTPSFNVRPAVTGQHIIEVGMIRCDAPRCWFAVNVYAR